MLKQIIKDLMYKRRICGYAGYVKDIQVILKMEYGLDINLYQISGHIASLTKRRMFRKYEGAEKLEMLEFASNKENQEYIFNRWADMLTEKIFESMRYK